MPYSTRIWVDGLYLLTGITTSAVGLVVCLHGWAIGEYPGGGAGDIAQGGWVPGYYLHPAVRSQLSPDRSFRRALRTHIRAGVSGKHHGPHLPMG